MGGLSPHSGRAGFRKRALVVAETVVLVGALTASVALGGRPAAASSSTAPNFHQAQRINKLTLQYGTDTFATQNRLGSAIASVAQGGLQTTITNAVNDGTLSILLEMLGLDDLTGISDASVGVGIADGTPTSDAGNPTSYDGSSDTDWWYTPSPDEVDTDGVPKSVLNGSIVARSLSVSGPSLSLTPNPIFPGGPGEMSMSSVHVTARPGDSSAPLESTNGLPPGHLPSEHVPSDLVSFASIAGDGTGVGLRGNVSAQSLSNTLIPPSFVSGGTTACTEGYASTNSLLDLLVGGCHSFFVTAVLKTQPDTADPAAPVGGTGAPYTLLAGSDHVVNGCKDTSNATVALATCLTAAAYSAYFKFTTDRVIVPPPSPLDLTETAVRPPPATAPIGTKIVVGDTALNDGSATTVATQTQYYLSSDQTRDASDILLKGARSVPSLDPSTSSKGTRKVVLPVIATGDYYVIACADDTGLVAEGDETDNCLASFAPIAVTAPDLVTTSVSNPPAAATPGASFSESATTGNIGNGPAGPTTTRFYVSLDKHRNAGDVLLDGSVVVTTLGAGASSPGTTTVTIPVGTAAGAYYVLACADDLKAVKESNEKNNCSPSGRRVTVG